MLLPCQFMYCFIHVFPFPFFPPSSLLVPLTHFLSPSKRGLDAVSQPAATHGDEGTFAESDGRPLVVHSAGLNHPRDAVARSLHAIAHTVRRHGNKGPSPNVTFSQLLSAALFCRDQVIPLAEVCTRLPKPALATATNKPFPKVTLDQARSAALF